MPSISLKKFKKCRENGLKGINWEEGGHYVTTFKGVIMLYNLTSSRSYKDYLGQKIHEIPSASSLTSSWTVVLGTLKITFHSIEAKVWFILNTAIEIMNQQRIKRFGYQYFFRVL